MRKALDDQGSPARYIETRWAEGYRFVGPAANRVAVTAAHGRRAPDAAGATRRILPTVETAAADRLVSRGNAYLGRFGHRNQRYALEMYRRALAVNPDDFTGLGRHRRQPLRSSLPPRGTDRRALERGNRSRAEALDRESGCQPNPSSRAPTSQSCARNYIEADVAFALAEVARTPACSGPGITTGAVVPRASDHERAVDALSEGLRSEIRSITRRWHFRSCRSSISACSDEARRTAQASVDAAERVLRRHPDDVRALSLGGCMLPGLNREGGGRGWTERAVALEPHEPYVNLNAACSSYDARRIRSRARISWSGCRWRRPGQPELDHARSLPRPAQASCRGSPRCSRQARLDQSR